MKLRQPNFLVCICLLLLTAFGCDSDSDGGSSCSVTEKYGGSAVIECEDGTSATIPAVEGPRGFEGDQGLAGDEGEQGEPGPVGDNGEQGEQGPVGDDGEQGEQGPVGDDGEQGEQGEPGAVGETGEPGKDGEPCSVIDNGDGTATVSCPDQSETTFWVGYSGRLFFTGDLAIDKDYEMWMVSVDGSIASPPRKLSGTLASGGDVSATYYLSADGNTLVYMADQDTEDLLELYYVDLSGSDPVTAVTISGSLASDSDIKNPRLSENGNTVVFAADIETDNQYDLYYVDLSTGLPKAPIKIDARGSADENVHDLMEVSPDGAKCVYINYDDATDVSEIYYVDLSTGTPGSPIRINPTLPDGGTVNSGIFISADSNTLLYRAEQETEGATELFMVDLSTATPGTPEKVSETLPAGREVEDGFIMSADGSSILYRSDADSVNVLELYWVDLSSGSPAEPVKLHPALPGSADVNGISISDDGDTVVYNADPNTASQNELFYVDLSSGTPASPLQINSPLSGGGNVDGDFVLTADGTSVIYLGREASAADTELYYVDLSSGSPSMPLVINDPLPTDGDVSSFDVADDGDTVVYLADQNVDEVYELFLVSIRPGGQPTAPSRMTPSLIPDTDVKSICRPAISP